MKKKILMSIMLSVLTLTSVYAEITIKQCYDNNSKINSYKSKKSSYEKRIDDMDTELQKRNEDLDSQEMWITTKKAVIEGIGASNDFINEYNRSVARFKSDTNSYNKLVEKRENLVSKYNDFIDDSQKDIEEYNDCIKQKFSKADIQSVCPRDSQNDFCLGFDLKKVYVCSMYDKDCKPENMGNIWEK